MEIRATTKYDLEAYTALFHLSLFKKNNPKRQMWLFTIIFIGLTALAINMKMSFAPYIICLLVSEMALIYFYFFIPKILYKSAKKTANISNTFTFKDDELIIISESTEFSGTSTIKYSMFFKVMETSKYFFILQNKSQAYIIDKRNIENGTYMDIRNKLISSVPVKKYIICRY